MMWLGLAFCVMLEPIFLGMGIMPYMSNGVNLGVYSYVKIVELDPLLFRYCKDQ